MNLKFHRSSSPGYKIADFTSRFWAKVDAPFLSYQANINDGVTRFPCLDTSRTGKYSSTCFPTDIARETMRACSRPRETPTTARICLQGFTGLKETSGAESVIAHFRRVPASESEWLAIKPDSGLMCSDLQNGVREGNSLALCPTEQKWRLRANQSHGKYK